MEPSGLAAATTKRSPFFTRQNNRLLTTGKSWVKNGDRFVVTATNPDGSMAVRRVSGGAEVMLPADYVAEHVELAYATTSYRSQGRTVDTTHSLVSPTTTREVLYVAATAWRESNMIYVDTSFDPDPATGHDGTIAQQSAQRGARRRARQRGRRPLRARGPREGTTPHRGLQRPCRRVRDPGPRRSTATLGRPAGSLGTRTWSPRAGSSKPRLRSTARSPPSTPRRAASTWNRPSPGSWRYGLSMTRRTPRRSFATESTVGHRPSDRRVERARISSQG